MSVKFRDYLEERLKDNDFRAEYEAIEREELYLELERSMMSTGRRYISGVCGVPVHA